MGIPHVTACQLLAPGTEPRSLRVEQGNVIVPVLGGWGLLTFEGAGNSNAAGLAQ